MVFNVIMNIAEFLFTNFFHLLNVRMSSKRVYIWEVNYLTHRLSLLLRYSFYRSPPLPIYGHMTKQASLPTKIFLSNDLVSLSQKRAFVYELIHPF